MNLCRKKSKNTIFMTSLIVRFVPISQAKKSQRFMDEIFFNKKPAEKTCKIGDGNSQNAERPWLNAFIVPNQ
jgi:hypothetical protein